MKSFDSMNAKADDAEQLLWVGRLKQLGIAVRQHILDARGSLSSPFEPIAHEGGDTIYALDRNVEPVIEKMIEQWLSPDCSICLIAEGFGPSGQRLLGNGSAPRYKLIVDPIDGTRGLMYDKRSAWFLAAICLDCGDNTRLMQSFASVMVELATTKQSYADSFSATADTVIEACRTNLETNVSSPLRISPSSATTLKDGFGCVSNFFPGTKILAAELMETIVRETLGAVRPGTADVFDDQYISSGGQLVELMLGHDRFSCDLRPLFYEILQREGHQVTRGLECHPYDMAGLLVAQKAGIIVTNGFGKKFDPPLDVHTGVHWCGYANRNLCDLIEPVILRWLKKKGFQ
jgi:hypothetical protein